MWSSKAKHPSRAAKTSKRYWIQFTRIRCPAYGTWLALIAAMFYSFARVSAVLKLKVDDYYDNGCAGEWDHLKREMPTKSPSSRRHLTS
jgi:hypothetical protein